MLRYWVGLSLVCGTITFVMLCLNVNKDRIIENQNRYIGQQNELIESQKQKISELNDRISEYDYLSEKMKAVDEYIVWKNILIPKNANYDFVIEDWNAERLDVIEKANWIKELNNEH